MSEPSTLNLPMLEALHTTCPSCVAFIFCQDPLVEEAAVGKPLAINLLANRTRRRGLRRRFGDVREYHAAVLAEYLKQPEMDFLQGRMSAPRFM